MGFAGPSETQTLYEWVSETSVPRAVGGGVPATPNMIDAFSAGYAVNLLRNGSFESWSSGTTSAPDGWTLTGAGGTLARNVTNVERGFASVNVTAAADTATDLAQSITISDTQNTRLRGRTMTFSGRVKVSTAARVFLKLDDGVGTAESVKHVGDGIFRPLTVSLTVSLTATKVECSCEFSSGASITATFDAFKLEEGETATGWTPNQNDEFTQPRILSQDGTDTTTSMTFVDLTRAGANLELANVIVNGNQSVLIGFRSLVSGSLIGDRVDFQLVRNGTTFNSGIGAAFPVDTADLLGHVAIMEIDSKPAAGNHTYKVQWKVINGSNTATAAGRTISITVVPSA